MPETAFRHEHDVRWFVLTVAPQHEVAVRERLIVKGYDVSVPMYRVRRRWSDRVKTITLPLFPGYVFCRFPSERRLPVLSTAGVRGAICFGGQLAALEDADVARVHKLAESGLQVEPLEGIRTGMRVRILDGPLQGVEGVLSQMQGTTRVVVNVELLNRSVAVQVDAGVIATVTPRWTAIPA